MTSGIKAGLTLAGIFVGLGLLVPLFFIWPWIMFNITMSIFCGGVFLIIIGLIIDLSFHALKARYARKEKKANESK